MSMAYTEIIALEPRIGVIIDKLKPSRSWRQYEQAKAAVGELVGWGAAVPELRTSAAYEAVIKEVITRLKI